MSQQNSTGKLLALVVEDHVDSAEIYATIVEQAGYAAEVVARGDEAIKRLKQEPRPALVILDLNLPQASGTDVLDVLREEDILRSADVILVTADEGLYRRSPALHGLRVRLKPLPYSVLLQEVTQMREARR